VIADLFSAVACPGHRNLRLKDMKVVIVDDDPDDLELYRDMFAAIDATISVKPFLHSVDGLSYLRLQPHPDLVILDLNMPVMSGLDFLHHVRADAALKDLHVAVITTACSNDEIQAVRALKANCLRKQSGFNDFVAILNRLLSETLMLEPRIY
jgi:CheY-like chemotaxis protein